MPVQSLIATRAPLGEAKQLFDALEAAFEDDGVPVAITEIDEANDIHEVSVYVEGDGAAEYARAKDAVQGLPAGAALRLEALPDIDWVAHSLKGLRPVRVGRIVVHGAHDRDAVRIGDIGIEIEAAQAFGTGHHGTTSGCIDMIEAVLRREKPRNALDLGAGSAVLAIAIAKLAHIPVLATDIDPVAMRVADGNLKLNRVGGVVDTVVATGFAHRRIGLNAPYDLIVANILARPLMSLAPAMKRHVASAGSIILSGILLAQEAQVRAAYVAQGFRHVRTLRREGWVTLHMKR